MWRNVFSTAGVACVAGALLILPALANNTAGEESNTARATLEDRAGTVVGQASFEETPHGVLLVATFGDAPAGTHAFHIHETGRCDPPTFESAGGHFAPGGTEHGFRDRNGPHAGDLPNVHLPGSGGGVVELLIDGVTLRTGDRSLLDSDGSALVLHFGKDDYQTDPAGDAGDRIACGVIRG
jgi:Cu-Zn family superoxide dismutase